MAKKKSIRYICPCCYANIDLEDIHYSCSNPECAPKFLDECSASDKRRYNSLYNPGHEIDVEKCEHLKIDPKSSQAPTSPYHIIRSSSNGACDICKSKNTTKLCPRCHTAISNGAEENGTTIFAVMGIEGSGKSHYLASLVRVLEDEYTEEFGTTFEPASEKTALKFDREYRNKVFVDHKCLPPTPSYTNEESRVPLLYFMGKEGEEGSRTIAFLDTSGRDLEAAEHMNVYNISTYIAGASGIVFMIDPLQVPAIRAKLGLTTTDGDYPELFEVLNKVVEVIHHELKMKSKEKLDIPLAVVLSKVDLLIRSATGPEDEDALFGPESSLHIEREKGIADSVNINQIGAEIEEYIRRNVGEEFIDEVDRFSNHQYFAVSSIGSDPREGNLIKGVAPYRVEDPVIWFLNQNERRRWF